jgi:hypothetical protein
MRALTKIRVGSSRCDDAAARRTHHGLTASSQCLTSALLSQVDERGQRAKRNSV